MKFSVLLMISMLFAGAPFANEQEITGDQAMETPSVAIDHEEFLGCVYSSHECQHEAEHHGYHHSSSVYDPYTCHHDHHAQVACYGIQ
jgi:hypothetical protein